jgi:hypothetical protein
MNGASVAFERYGLPIPNEYHFITLSDYDLIAPWKHGKIRRRKYHTQFSVSAESAFDGVDSRDWIRRRFVTRFGDERAFHSSSTCAFNADVTRVNHQRFDVQIILDSLWLHGILARSRRRAHGVFETFN